MGGGFISHVWIQTLTDAPPTMAAGGDAALRRSENLWLSPQLLQFALQKIEPHICNYKYIECL